MSERLQELQTDLGDDEGSDTSDAAGTSPEAERGRLAGLRSRIPSPSVPFSPRRFGLAIALLTVGIVAGGWVPLVGAITQYVGLFAAAFLLGAIDRASYLEAGTAGAAAGGVSTVLGLLSTGGFVIGVDLFRRYGLAVAGVGVFAGLAIAIVGLYFGRDLRNGVTRSI